MIVDQILEELLRERKNILQQINIQEQTILSLDAYKRTLVKCLCKDQIAYSFPTDFSFDLHSKITKIDQQFPLLILNKGKTLIAGQSFPINYKCLRHFRKTGQSNEMTWYTTTILKKKDCYFFLIKDDQNNTWRGKDAFTEFTNSFEGKIPFETIQEWLGCGEVKKAVAKPSEKIDIFSLDSFITRQN